MGQVAKSVDNTTKVFIAILILGLVGLLFLIIFGNLSGNLGFQNVQSTTTNEAGYAINGTTYTLSTASASSFVSLSVTSVVNATDGTTVSSGNYTVSSTAGTIVGGAGRTANWSAVNITYVTTSTSNGETNSNNVINNLTQGASTFFTFSNVWFTLLAIVLLIIIVIAVIAVVQKRGGEGKFAS